MITNTAVYRSSVATGGHGWARAYPAPTMLGYGIRADPKVLFFWGVRGREEMEDGHGNKLA